MNKKLSVLGSTGSIGTQTLEVARNIEGFEIKALAANSNIDLLQEQILEFEPELAAVMDEKAALELKRRLFGNKTEIMAGADGIIEAARFAGCDMTVAAIVGSAGLIPTLAAIRAGKDIALANKETLVTAGGLIMREAADRHVNIYPVDSEHSAVFQALQGSCGNKPVSIILTASGGPFRNMTRAELCNVTAADALKHPNWVMGAKITIDSATLMNKGLETIEAKWLFDMELDRIKVLVHPQSIIHSMVEFEDGAVMAQLGAPDMRIPIQYALTYPKRVPNGFRRLNFAESNTLTFEEPRRDVFECLNLAAEAARAGGTMPAVMNMANECAVDLFLNGAIGFFEIPELIRRAMDAYTIKYDYCPEDIAEAENRAREFIKGFIKSR